jgi:hypothetical protein
MNKSVCHAACHHLAKSQKNAQYQDTWTGRGKKMKLSLPTKLHLFGNTAVRNSTLATFDSSGSTGLRKY